MTMSEMRKQLRKLWERSEEVALLRDARRPTALGTATICRNDAILSVEIAFSALRHENERLRAQIIQLEGGER